MASQVGGINISTEEIKTKEGPTMQRDPGSNNNRAEVGITIETTEAEHPPNETKEVEHLNKVPKRLQQMEPFSKFFEPSVVSLGPYHHHKKHLQVTLDDKRKIKDYLLRNQGKNAEDFDTEEMNFALKDARDLYVEDSMSTEEFNDMMILDACFIIHIVDYIGKMKKAWLGITPHLLPLVVEDILLLENQIPFAVLEAAIESLGDKVPKQMILSFFWIVKFPPADTSASGCSDKNDNSYVIKMKKLVMHIEPLRKKVRTEKHNYQMNMKKLSVDRKNFWDQGKKVHLLQILREDLLRYRVKKEAEPQSYSWHLTRCATELKAVGINFEKIETRFSSLEDVKFEQGFIFGQLFLPSINQLTKRRLLNLIAYELSSKHCGYGIISYVSFLDGLIDRPEDVKELRSKNILPKGLGSDEEVVEFFNMVGTDLAPDPCAYLEVSQDIDAHCCDTWRATIGHIHHKYFGSRSDTISFLIATFLFLITLAQAYATFFPLKN